jgi:hypothetical protein
MCKKRKRSNFISSNATEKPTANKFINKHALKLDEFSQEGNNAFVFLSLKYLQHKTQCFSDWPNSEMGAFWSFNKSIHQTTWQNVYASSGKKNKTGLAYTKIEIKQYPKTVFSQSLSEDITLFELRLNQKMRVHGFRHKSVFYLCWLDREHNLLSK